VKTLLDETDSWVWEGSETTCGIYGETDSETFDETNKKRNEKTTSNLLYPWKTMDRNISSPISFPSPKVKLHLRRHCPQSIWGWQMSLPDNLLGNFVRGIPDDG
jgi:hypothetical protein